MNEMAHKHVAKLLAVQTFALAIWLGWQALNTNAQDAPRAPTDNAQATRHVAETIPAGRAPWIGVSGCAAAACHGGAIDQPRGEYTTWITRDPHARAYSALFSERSLEMARLLAGGDATKATPPQNDQRCLACHAPSGPRSDRSARLVSDGVGCESCHGAADTWATRHATVRWDELAPDARSAKRRELGMTDMHDPLVRVEQCTVCHVGSVAADVDHDLIAAGHPRLSFEMGAFHAELPKHWPDKEERRRDPTFEARLWAIGQAQSAGAYCDLIASKKDRGLVHDFADFDCYACHHELRSPSWRLPEDQASWGRGKLRPLAWYEPPIQDGVNSTLDLLSRTHQPWRTADRRERAQRYYALARDLRDGAIWNEPSLEQSLAKLAAHPPEDLTWDAATQRYLALVALERCRLDFRGNQAPTEYDKAVQAALESIKRLLNFPPESDGVQLNSPRDFDPAALRQAAGRLQALLESRPAGEGASP